MNTAACKRLFSLGCVAHTDGAVFPGANDDEAARALFAEYDANANGYIGPEEVRALAAALLPGEDWDDTLWCAATPTHPP